MTLCRSAGERGPMDPIRVRVRVRVKVRVKVRVWTLKHFLKLEDGCFTVC